MTRPFPLPEDAGIRKARPSVYLYRAAAAHIRSYVARTTPERAARELFGNDPVTAEVLRAASSPATIGNAAWAGALAQTSVDDSIQAMTSVSAAAGLIARGMQVTFDSHAAIKIPGRLVDANDAGAWVGEGGVKRVRAQRITAGPTLTPHKLAVIVTFTAEMASSSNIEAVSRALISEASALALDKALFGTQADDGVTPGGILAGVTPITPTAGGGLNALNGDMRALVAALVAAGAGANPVLITSPVQATTLRLTAGPKFDVPTLVSSVLAAGTVIAVEPSSFVSAFGAAPEFETGTESLLHYEDTAPVDFGTPSKSLFQIDSMALKMVLRAAWGLRAPHVAVINSATW
jgi:HK97 family phage major capsid protein